MKKYWLAAVLAVLCLAAALARLAADEKYRTALTKDGRGVVRTPAPFDFERGALAALPLWKPGERDPFKIDLRSYDLSALNLQANLEDLLRASFDSRTKWPAELPEGFYPDRFMELGKNPGLGVRELHKRGITGKGVGVAVIDMGFLVNHVEYADRLKLFEEIHAADETAQMHGLATASIAVGKTVGVAPESDLYYIAFFPEGEGSTPERTVLDFTWVAKPIRRILEVNRSLPADRKIRVISISIGWNPGDAGYDDVMQAVEEAGRDGVFVASVTMERSYGFRISALGREPLKDPDVIGSFGVPWWGSSGSREVPALYVPMDSRTTASPTGPEDYVFYRLGGLSWSVPWAAGLYALACQVKPGITPKAFFEKARETGDIVELPPLRPSMTEEEIKKLVDGRLAESMKRIKTQSEGKDLETFLAEVYSQESGQKKEKMGEADFRAWVAEMLRTRVLLDTKPRRLDKVANPIRLIGDLIKGK